MSETASLDPIALEINWNGLKSIADECFLTVMRSAFSTNIKERHDHSTAIADARGRLIVQAEKALPIHLASMSGLLRNLIAQFGDDLVPGDMFIGNDPYASGGTHLPDICFAAPIFHQGRLLGFVGNVVHHADVGGAAVGSMSGGLDEIYKEGLRIPVVRLARGGEMQEDMLRLILLNMRLPDERRGDLNAQIAAINLGVQRVGAMAERIGDDILARCFEEILGRTRLRMKAAIARIPDGSYAFTDYMDDDGLGAEDIRIDIAIRKAGEAITVDFAGTHPQVRGNFNLTLDATRACVCFALKALLDPQVPNNQGVVDAVEILAPEGSIVNCVSPASVALRANTGQRIVDVVIGALADALPDQVIAAANGSNTSAVFSGIDPRTGQQYLYFETLGGGMGARATHDGKDGVQVHTTNTSNLPIEDIEQEYPLRVECYALIEDSGGAGRFRGGMGIRRVVRPVGHTCEFSGVGERFRYQPWGLFGGKPGAIGAFALETDAGERRELPSKTAGIRLGPDTRVVIDTPGAGGYGPPASRAWEARLRDSRSGKFSDEYMAVSYGPRWQAPEPSDEETEIRRHIAE